MKRHSVFKNGLSIFSASIFGYILSLFIFFSIGLAFDSLMLRIVVQIICILTFYGPIYMNAWGFGDRDCNYVSFNRIKKDMLFGLKIGLIAVIPYFLTSAILIYSKLNPMHNLVLAYKLLNTHLFGIIYLIAPSAEIKDFSWPDIFLLNALNIFIPAVSTLGYVLGFKRISISQKLIFKNKK